MPTYTVIEIGYSEGKFWRSTREVEIPGEGTDPHGRKIRKEGETPKDPDIGSEYYPDIMKRYGWIE